MTVAVAGIPTNLHLPPDAQVTECESDLYNMCTRVSDEFPQLHINLVTHNGQFVFIIMERCEDGVDRKLFQVNELDARVLPRIREALAVPLHTRLEVALKEQDKYDRERLDNELEDMYERFGREMWYRFEKDGFIENRPVSYPKRGVSGPSRGA